MFLALNFVAIDFKKRYLSTRNITILGAYYPNKSKIRLVKLRDYLRKSGFAKAKLVEDSPPPNATNIFLPSQGEINLVNSQYIMLNSDALIFVFGISDQSTGHHLELQYFYDNLYNQLIDKTLFLVEEGAMHKLSSLIQGYINVSKNSPGTYCFQTFKELCEYATYQLYSIFTIY